MREQSTCQGAPMLGFVVGLKIRRRKACQFESGRGHQRLPVSEHYRSRIAPAYRSRIPTKEHA